MKLYYMLKVVQLNLIILIEGNRNVYSTDIKFLEEFEYCNAIKLVDIFESLNKYGVTGTNTNYGYDLDAVYGFRVMYYFNYDGSYGKI